MRIGSLFSGIGGLELGLEWAGVGHTVWQVESDAYCRAVLAKHWPDAQRFDDVRSVGAHNLPPVNVVCGGFPCQDISVAGRGAGIQHGTRSGLWYEFARIIGELRPSWVVVENVVALERRGLSVVLGDLRSLGYCGERLRISAAGVGAPHLRWRLFVVAYAMRGRAHAEPEPIPGGSSQANAGWHGTAQSVAHSHESGLEGRRRAELCECGAERAPRSCGASLADSEGNRRRQGHTNDCGRCKGARARTECGPWGSGKTVGDAIGVRQLQPQGREHDERRWPCDATWWRTEPDVGRVADGIPARVDRLRALGNAVVPQVAEVVGRRLLQIAGGLT